MQMIFLRYYDFQDCQRNKENINKLDYYAFKIYIRFGKDSFSQYKDGCKEKKTKTDITDCKLLNRKSDNLARLQSR